MFKAVADGFGYLFGLLGRLGTFILEGIGKLLAPVFELLGALFYFFYMLGVLLVKIILLVVGVCKLLLGLLKGLFLTITGLSYTGQGAVMPGSLQSAFTNLNGHLTGLQLDNLAYLLQFGLWMITAFFAIRKIMNMKGGGNG